MTLQGICMRISAKSTMSQFSYLEAFAGQSNGDDGHVGDFGAVDHVLAGGKRRRSNRLLDSSYFFHRTGDERSA